MDASRWLCRRMRLRLLGVLGLTALSAPGLLVACSDDSDNNTTSTNATSSRASSTVSSTAASTAGSGGNGGDGGTSQGGQGGQGGMAEGGNGQGGGGNGSQFCWTKPDPNQPCPDMNTASQWWTCTEDGMYSVTGWISGPVVQNDMCCYVVTTDVGCVVIGRPFLIEEEALTASVVNVNSDWCDADLRPRIADLPADVRQALAKAWANDGLYEHASIASFARFALALMALGAPADLVDAAHRAAIDEVRHAQQCFALASAYAGEALSPGSLPVPATIDVPQTLVDLAVSTAIEGCIGETIASIVAHEQHLHCRDEVVGKALAAIAADETRHAELAWRTVAWAIERGGHEVRTAVADVFRRAAAHLPNFEASDGGLAAHGRLDQQTLSNIKRRALEEVVLPCAAALFSSGEKRAPELHA